MTALSEKFAKIMAVLPKRAKNRYDFVQDTFIPKNGKRCFDKGNISKLASFLYQNKECSTWPESMSKAWELAKAKKASYVNSQISGYSLWTKGD